VKLHIYTFTIWTDDDDCMPPIYFRVSRDGCPQQHSSKELSEGYTWADYAEDGNLIGVEMLAPDDVELLDKIPTGSMKSEIRIHDNNPDDPLVL
jgi:hypothetical protein